MSRFWLRLAVGLLACAFALALGVVALIRWSGVGTVLEYQRFWPSNDIVWANYADVDHNLHISFDYFLQVTWLPSTETSADGREVQSLPTPGNVDLFLFQSEDSRPLRLTRFSDFPPDRNGAETRRSNLFARWSPDNQWITFLSTDAVGKIDLYAIHPNGNDLRLIAERVLYQIPTRPRWVNLNGGHDEPGWGIFTLLSLGLISVFLAWRFSPNAHRAPHDR